MAPAVRLVLLAANVLGQLLLLGQAAILRFALSLLWRYCGRNPSAVPLQLGCLLRLTLRPE